MNTKRIITLSLCFALMLSLVFSSVSANNFGVNSIEYGDVNDDKRINATDVLFMRKYLVDNKFNINISAADVKYDSKINASDVLILKKYLAKYKVKLGPDVVVTTTVATSTIIPIPTTVDSTTQPTTLSPTTTTVSLPAQNIYNMVELADSMRSIGRTVLKDTSIKSEMTASGIEFSAYCGGDITAQISWQKEEGLIGVMIDNDFNNMKNIVVKVGASNVKIADNLEVGNHTIRIVKLNEYNRNAMTIQSVTLNGNKLGVIPEEKDLKIEFYGDSITCGYGNLTSSRTMQYPFTHYEDGYKTYAAYASQELNADFSVIAASGYGILRSYGGSTTQTFNEFWDNSLVASEKVKHDFNSFKADIVVVNLGTNDYSYANNSKTAVSNDEIKAGIMNIIDKIKSVNPTAKIVWLAGMNGKLKNSYIDIDSVLSSLTTEVQDFYYKGDLYTGQNGGDWHPNAADHKTVSSSVVNFLRTVISK